MEVPIDLFLLTVAENTSCLEGLDLFNRFNFSIPFKQFLGNRRTQEVTQTGQREYPLTLIAHFHIPQKDVIALW
jgi:hypothetical protein